MFCVVRLMASSAPGCFRLPIVKALSLLLMKFPLAVADPLRVHFTPSSLRAVEDISRIMASMMICRAGLSISRFIKSSSLLIWRGSFSL